MPKLRLNHLYVLDRGQSVAISDQVVDHSRHVGLKGRIVGEEVLIELDPCQFVQNALIYVIMLGITLIDNSIDVHATWIDDCAPRLPLNIPFTDCVSLEILN